MELNSKWKKKISSLFRKHTETPIAQKPQIIAGSQVSCKIRMNYILFSVLIFFYLRCRVFPAPLGSLRKIVSSIPLSQKATRKRMGEQAQWDISIEDGKFKSSGNSYLEIKKMLKNNEPQIYVNPWVGGSYPSYLRVLHKLDT